MEQMDGDRAWGERQGQRVPGKGSGLEKTKQREEPGRRCLGEGGGRHSLRGSRAWNGMGAGPGVGAR